MYILPVRVGIKPRRIKPRKVATEAASLSFTLPAGNLSPSPLTSDNEDENPLLQPNSQQRQDFADVDSESDLSSDEDF